MFNSGYVKCYCAFCRNPRVIFRKKALSILNIFQSVAIASAFTYGIWGNFDPKGLILLIFVMVIFEAIILIRRRLSVECIHCGFDAYLYLRDQKKACEKVKAHLALRGQDPDVWLARKAPVRLPSRRVPKNSTREIIA